MNKKMDVNCPANSTYTYAETRYIYYMVKWGYTAKQIYDLLGNKIFANRTLASISFKVTQISNFLSGGVVRKASDELMDHLRKFKASGVFPSDITEFHPMNETKVTLVPKVVVQKSTTTDSNELDLEIAKGEEFDIVVRKITYNKKAAKAVFKFAKKLGLAVHFDHSNKLISIK